MRCCADRRSATHVPRLRPPLAPVELRSCVECRSRCPRHPGVSSGIPGGRRRVGRSANRPEPFLVLGITGLIFAVVFGLIAYTVVAYRGRAEDDGEEPAQSAARGWPAPAARPMWDGSRAHHSWRRRFRRATAPNTGPSGAPRRRIRQHRRGRQHRDDHAVRSSSRCSPCTRHSSISGHRRAVLERVPSPGFT
jgi:hypothetical protein